MKKVRHSEKLGVDYVFCRKEGEGGKYLTEDGIVITEEEASTMSDDEVKKLYKKRKDDGAPYDFEYAKTTGFIRKKKNLSFANDDESEEQDSTIAGKITERRKLSINKMKVVEIVTALVALGAVVLSIMYNADYQILRVGAFKAWIQASIMVTFATIAFEAGILFIRKGGVWILFGALFFVFWILPASYSMLSIMDVTYANMQKATQTNIAVVNTNNAVTAAIATAEKNIVDAEKQLANKQKAYDNYIGQEKYSQWQATQLLNALDKQDAAVKQFRKEKQEIIDKNPTVATTEVKHYESFFARLEKMYGIKQTTMEMLVNVLPAAFLDIVAPFGFAVVIFLEEKGNGNKGKRRKGKEEDADSDASEV